MKVLAALSGGVDSSTAARILVDEGHDVVGVTMLLWGGEREKRSCSTADESEARKAAENLGIDLEVIDWTDDFNEEVVGEFAREAQKGRTTNPCITCNRVFKIDRLFVWAEERGFDAVATGHYARVVDYKGTPHVARGLDEHKDQSYVISPLGPGQLSKLILPLGGLTKDEVRVIAEKAGVPAAKAPESMDLCFSRANAVKDRGVHEATLVGPEGQNLGKGEFELLTVGQRKGLGVSYPEPLYVGSKDADSFQVKLVRKAEAEGREFGIENLTWIYGPVDEVAVQVSAHGEAVACEVNDHLVCREATRQRPASGQHAVFYDGDVVVGWATIV